MEEYDMNVVELPLDGKYATENRKYCLIPRSELLKCIKLSWKPQTNGRSFYVCGYYQKKHLKIHRFIMDVDDPKIIVDHKNHNTFDNTFENLRICNTSESSANRRSPKSSFSKYLGVCWAKDRGKYRSTIAKNKKKIHIGFFDNEIEAAKAYDRYALEIHKEFAYLNFPESIEEYRKMNNVDLPYGL